MGNIRRDYIPDAIYFITCVSYHRKELFDKVVNIDLFWRIFKGVKKIYSLKIYAHVLLYEHFHFLINPAKGNISKVMHSLKISFSKEYKKIHNIEENIRLWQYRFWDHIIRDENDFKTYFDYIHYNPVKHRLVKRPEDFGESSYRFWVRKGVYQLGWGYDIDEKLEELDLE